MYNRDDIYMDWSGAPFRRDFYGTVMPERYMREERERIIIKKVKYLCEYCGRKYEGDENCTCDYCGAPLKVLKDETEDTL